MTEGEYWIVTPKRSWGLPTDGQLQLVYQSGQWLLRFVEHGRGEIIATFTDEGKACQMYIEEILSHKSTEAVQEQSPEERERSRKVMDEFDRIHGYDDEA